MGFVPELPLFQHHFIFMSLCCPMCFNYIYFYFLNSMSYFFVETVLPGPSYLHKIHLSEQKAYKHKKSKNVLCKNLFKMIPSHSSHLSLHQTSSGNSFLLPEQKVWTHVSIVPVHCQTHHTRFKCLLQPVTPLVCKFCQGTFWTRFTPYCVPRPST